MGIPSFYRWLAERYPLMIVDVVEEKPVVIDGINIPIDTSKPNPCNIEYDNLYLDLNGIIHPCFHPENQPSPSTFDEVFQNVFDYIDRLFNMVRPRKLLYMAIDGVAPRAKMNQQRCRRFRAAKDVAEAASEKERLLREFEIEGKKLAPKEVSETWDSNIITPGTKFMGILSTALQYYVHLRLNSDPGWKSIKVLLSDANVPGEGEHKIMSYIRLQRNLPGYDPNTRHCLYGLDADLIMLALASHEVHFSILREMQVLFASGQEDKCFRCGQVGHMVAVCKGKAKRKAQELDVKREDDGVSKKPFQFLNVWTLREYLEYEFVIPNPPFEINFERIVDDFIFISLFVGNDFLPHMPTLEIREGAISLLTAVYKKEFSGYLTDGSKPILAKVECFIQAVGLYEGLIFQKRALLRRRQENRARREKAHLKRGDDAQSQYVPESLVPVSQFHGSQNVLTPTPSLFSERHNDSADSSKPQKVARFSSTTTVGAAMVEAVIDLEKETHDNKKDLEARLEESAFAKSNVFYLEEREDDKIQLGLPGWKERYYEEKFCAKSAQETQSIQKDVVLKYIEGLFWVMHYYYEGVCSWQWYYPYHYAPFASDLKNISSIKIRFDIGTPFKPFDQLMGVLPAASAHALPVEYRNLMCDPDSPIIDFYPEDFDVDMNDKRYSWQGIVKLPFIDEARLLAETTKIEHTLSAEEKRRNTTMFDMLFVARSHPLSSYILSLAGRCQYLDATERALVIEQIDPEASGGMNGYISLGLGNPCPAILMSPVDGLEDIVDNQVICTIYELPEYHKHLPLPPPGVEFPVKIVSKGNLKRLVLWHETTEYGHFSSGVDKVLQNRGMRHKDRVSRTNPLDSISGLELEKAAHQLVVNSFLKGSADHKAYHRHMHGTPPFFCGLAHLQPNNPAHCMKLEPQIRKEKITPKTKTATFNPTGRYFDAEKKCVGHNAAFSGEHIRFAEALES